MFNDTIAAISTPFGKGGVAIIRVSGSDAVEICSKMFAAKNKKALSEQKERAAVYGDIFKDGEVIDDGVVTVFKSPNSYTGEDTVEICCHGGILLTQNVLMSVLDCGARSAQAGEFTKRAYLNGKLGLSKAEAIINLIDAETNEQIKLANSHKNGVLARRADDIYDKILKLLSSSYAFIDYPDEDLRDVTKDEFLSSLNVLESELSALEQSYNIGKAVREGVKTAIIGKPNAGKSSLLNAMLGEKRAIVTDIAGTTRDIIEESVKLKHIVLRLSDTAGIRDTNDTVEKIGVELAYDRIRNSELVIAVFDTSCPLEKEDRDIIDFLKYEFDLCRVIAVLNKNDAQICKEAYAEIENTFKNTVSMSAKDAIGVDELFSLAEGLFVNGEINYSENAVIANTRQLSAVRRARESVGRAKESLCDGYSEDMAGLVLEEALGAIGELDSRSVGENIVNEIFSNFCVGK